MTHRVPIERELDLHTFAPRDISPVVSEYVHAAHAEGLAEVRIVHGRGRGIKRRTVHEALADHSLVEEYWDDSASHLGATIARLKDA